MASTEKIIDILNQGGVIAYPTETVYGLGCDPFQEEAVKRILTLKERKEDRPFILLIPNREWVSKLTETVSPLAMGLIERFWPGPLTLVLEASQDVPYWLKQRDNTIAFRISSHPWVQEFLGFYGKPLVSTSANRSGFPPARNAEEVRHYFSQGIDLVIEGEILPPSLGSTIVSVKNDRLDILREGDISKEKIYGANRAV